MYVYTLGFSRNCIRRNPFENEFNTCSSRPESPLDYTMRRMTLSNIFSNHENLA